MTRGVKRKFEILAAERTEKFLSSWFRRGSDRKCLRQEVLVCSHIHRFTLTPNTIPTHTWQSFSAKVFFFCLFLLSSSSSSLVSFLSTSGLHTRGVISIIFTGTHCIASTDSNKYVLPLLAREADSKSPPPRLSASPDWSIDRRRSVDAVAADGEAVDVQQVFVGRPEPQLGGSSLWPLLLCFLFFLFFLLAGE